MIAGHEHSANNCFTGVIGGTTHPYIRTNRVGELERGRDDVGKGGRMTIIYWSSLNEGKDSALRECEPRLSLNLEFHNLLQIYLFWSCER